MQILESRHEVGGATDNNFFQFVMKRPGVGGDVVSSRVDRLYAGLLDRYFRGRCRSGEAGPLLSPGIVGRIPVGHPCLSLLISCDQSEAKPRLVRADTGWKEVGVDVDKITSS